MKRLFVRVCAAAVAAAALSGCAALDAHEAGSVPRGLTPSERLRVFDAGEVLVGRCMNRAGFAYWTSPRTGPEESRFLGYVADDVRWAREHGYGSRIREREDRERRSDANARYRASLSPERRAAYSEALDGGSAAAVLSAVLPGGSGTIRKRLGGCSAEAEKQLYGDAAAWFRADKVVGNLQPLYVPQLMRDARFTASLSDWSRCMARSGHAYPDPPAARAAATRRGQGLDPERAFSVETRIAVAEARCARESSLAAVGRERETHYRDGLRERYGDAMDTHRRLEFAAYERAVTVTGPRS